MILTDPYPTRTPPLYRPKHKGRPPGMELIPWRTPHWAGNCRARHCNHGTGQ